MANKIFNIGNLICEKGWKLWDIGGNWTKWVQSMYLNSKKWYFWPDGQYFNPSLNSCQGKFNNLSFRLWSKLQWNV